MTLIKNLGRVNKYILENSKKITIFLIILIILVLKLFFSSNFWAGIYGLGKAIEMAFLFLISAQFIKEKNIIPHIALVLSLGMVLEVVLALFQLSNQGSIGGAFYFLGERYFTSETPGIASASINSALYLRPYATFPHPNVMAGYLLLIQVFLLSQLRSIKGRLKSLIGASLLISFLGILIALSRVAIILEVIILIYFVLSVTKKKLGKKILISLLIFVLLIFSSISNALPRLLSTRLGEESVASRQLLVQESLRMIVKNPVDGIGANNFLNALASEKDQPTPLQPVHNLPLHVIAELGLPLGVALFMMYWSLLMKVNSAKVLIGIQRKEALLILLLIAALGMFDHYLRTTQQGQMLIVVLLGWVYGSVVSRNVHKKIETIG